MDCALLSLFIFLKYLWHWPRLSKFAAKLLKKVDSQVISVLIGLVVVIIAPWLERLFKGNKQAAAKPAQRTTKASRPSYHTKTPVSVSANKVAASAAASMPSSEYFNERFEEGRRVTTDEAPAEMPKTQSQLKPLSADELRRAVIWGEILKPKF